MRSLVTWALLASAAVGCGRVDFDLLGDGGTSTSDSDSSIDADLGPATYSDITDVTNWSAFDTTQLGANVGGFTGAVFDGRYLYLVPSYFTSLHGNVVRYDTTLAFADLASWSLFDTTTLGADARGFNGGAFDGRYVYFVPHENLGGYNGIVTRYDTQGTFEQASSWSVFNTQGVNGQARGFYGAVFDGRYLYLASYNLSTIARYDTTASFTNAASWSFFDVSVVDANNPAYIGGVFDGRYVYFNPFISAAPSGNALRFDTQASFTSASAWAMFDVTAVHANAGGFAGAGFDGRYLYYAPFLDMGGSDGRVTRYDTQATYAQAASWSSYDISAIDVNAKGYFGAGFDGRYMYFAPYPGRTVARVDTTGTFDDPASWSMLDVAGVTSGASGFYGAAFDGRALYLVAHAGSRILRFDAKSPASVPSLPGFYGSFF